MNTRYGFVAVLFCTSLLLSGCGDSHEKLTAEMLDTMDQVPKILADVKDEKTAKEAAPKLEKIAQRMQALDKRRKELGDPTEEEQKRLDKEFEDRTKKTLRAIAKETTRIVVDPKMREVILKAMMEMPKRS